jgi:hypothetical protein
MKEYLLEISELESLYKDIKINIDMDIINENEENDFDKYEEDITSNKYKLRDLFDTFNKFDEAAILIQVKDNKIKFIEKKGYESRNQSVIDLLMKAMKYKPINNVVFLIFTNDFIKDKNLESCPFLFSFCKNHNYHSQYYFPNFNFNHWKEANIDYYYNVYFRLKNKNVNKYWDDKDDIIFWSGANTNTIRKKIYDTVNNLKTNNSNFLINLLDKNDDKPKKYYSILEHAKYKYLLNLNGYSYGGRLNYLFMTGSCVIILKNRDKNNIWNEFFYEYFIPGVDYIEIEYNNNDKGEDIIKNIIDTIGKNDCEQIANNCFEKACYTFDLYSIYEYISATLNSYSNKIVYEDFLKNSVFMTPAIDIYFEDRLYSNDGKNIEFSFKGEELFLKINEDDIELIIKNDNLTFLVDNKKMLEKYTPKILNHMKYQKYKISLDFENNIFKFKFIVNDKFTLFSYESDNLNGTIQDKIKIKNIYIKTPNHIGYWIQ